MANLADAHVFLMQNQSLSELGWQPSIDLEDGITGTYKWYSEPD